MCRVMWKLLLSGVTLCCLLSPALAHADGAKIALVIGNADYAHWPLRNPVNDAQDISRVLAGLGFDVITGIDVDRRHLRLKIRKFGKRLRRAEIGFFYYAGHGIQYNGENYLIPLRADITNEAEIADEAISVNSVLRQMDIAANKVNVIVLDACRNNPFSRDFRFSGKGLVGMHGPAGSYIAYATAPGETAADGNGRNGLYTQHLLQHIKNTDITIEQVMKQVRIGVSESTGGRQIPWENSSLMGNFYFNADGYQGKSGTPRPSARGSGEAAAASPLPPTSNLIYLAASMATLMLSALWLAPRMRGKPASSALADTPPPDEPETREAIREAPRVVGYLVSLDDQRTQLEVTRDHTLSIGRDDSAGIHLDRTDASRYHARVGWDAGEESFWIEDMGSTNGTGLLSAKGQFQLIPALQRVPISYHQVFCIIDRSSAFCIRPEKHAPSDATVVVSAPTGQPPRGSRAHSQEETLVTLKKGLIKALDSNRAVGYLTTSHSLIMGRDPRLDIPINKPEVSGRHAELRWNSEANKCEIRDLGTLNGTWVLHPRTSTRQRLPANRFVTLENTATFYLADRSNAYAIAYFAARKAQQ